MNNEQLRAEMVAICREALEMKLFAGTSGNLSVSLGDGTMLITPTCLRYTIMQPEDIVHCDLDGNVLSGSRQPSSEWRMHASIYKNFSHKAIFHTHSPYATAFAVLRKDIPPVLIETNVFLGGKIPCADYALPGTQAVGDTVVECMARDNSVSCLMANHGCLAVGETLDEAMLRAEYVEDTAKIYHFALTAGEPFVV